MEGHVTSLKLYTCLSLKIHTCVKAMHKNRKLWLRLAKIMTSNKTGHARSVTSLKWLKVSQNCITVGVWKYASVFSVKAMRTTRIGIKQTVWKKKRRRKEEKWITHIN